jgi:D-xylose transport system substrate-binding protein
MKKVISLVLSLVLLASLFTFAGCSGKDDGKVKIGLSLPTQREERWVKDKEKMEAEAKKLGIELIVTVADANMSEQITQVESLIAKNIDVLILAPHDAAAAATLVEKANKKKIPVISYDRLITNTDKLDVYLSFDNVEVGRLQGKFITELVPKGNYIIMSGAPTDNNAKLFKQGAMEFIQPLIDKGDIKVVAEQAVDNWEPQNAQKIVEAALAKTKDVQAILAPNDGTAGGAIQALKTQGLAGKVPVTGQDAELAAARRIVAGEQSMTIFKDTRLLGEKAVELANQLAKGEKITTNGEVDNGKIKVPSVLLKPYSVDKASVDELLIGSGYLKKEDVYK